MLEEETIDLNQKEKTKKVSWTEITAILLSFLDPGGSRNGPMK